MKSNFYDVFVTIMPGLFNTRDRNAHARKRRLVAHVFSMRSVQAYQPLVLSHLHVLLEKWDGLCAKGKKNAKGVEGDSVWRGADGRVWFDCFPCKSSSARFSLILSLLTRSRPGSTLR